MEEDLRAMMCADALATARSTLSRMTTFHTTAKTIYGPIQCNDDFNEVGLIRRDVEVKQKRHVYMFRGNHYHHPVLHTQRR